MKINVYDFDGTIYRGDSSVDFYIYALHSNLKIIFKLPLQFFNFLRYKMRIISKREFKESYFSFLKNINNIDDLVCSFWKANDKKINRWYFAEKSSSDVIVSASPEFLIKPIGDQLGAIKTIATLVNKKTGEFISENCYGNEKVLRLNKEFSSYKIEKFFSDSNSDLPLKNISQIAFKVRGSNIRRW